MKSTYDNKIDPWFFDVDTREKRGIYVCLSGNSATGKSTLLRKLGKAISGRDERTIIIDEKTLHHPFLPYLFFTPEKWSFRLQLNFMLQRSMLVGHWVGKGFSLLMERSHQDDLIFIRHLLNEGYVTQREHDDYVNLWHDIDRVTPLPDLMIFLNMESEISISRLTKAEEIGDRPREFPSEEKKIRWLTAWHRLYLERIQELQDTKNETMKILSVDATQSSDSIADQAMKIIQTTY